MFIFYSPGLISNELAAQRTLHLKPQSKRALEVILKSEQVAKKEKKKYK